MNTVAVPLKVRIKAACFSLLLLSGLAVSAHAQTYLELDAVPFRYDSTKSQVEVYYGLVKKLLNFSSTDNAHWVAPINAEIQVWQEGAKVGERTISKQVTFDGTKQQLDADAANKIIDMTAFNVPSNKPTTVFIYWHSKVGGKDLTDTVQAKIANVITPASQPSLSEIELASSVTASDNTSNPFVKAGFEVIPNPSLVFGEQYTKLYYYSELYLPKEYVDPNQSAEVTSRIVDGAGHEMFTSTKQQPLLAATVPVIGSISIDGLPGDTYSLEVIVKKGGQVIARNVRKFFYETDFVESDENTQSGGQNDEAIYLSSNISKFSEAELSEHYDQFLYVAKPDEKKSYNATKDLEGKRKLFFAFWRSRDLNPKAKPLSSYTAYYERVAEANKKFNHLKTPGWKTGRGQVFIKYGNPDRIDPHMFEPNARPYIVWTYFDRGGLQLTSGNTPEFDFVDRQGGGNFLLVNSNVLNEVQQNDWYAREVYVRTGN